MAKRGEYRNDYQSGKRWSLPHTEGFFFAESENDEEQRNEDVQLLEDAFAWVRTKEDGVWRSLIYHASRYATSYMTCRFWLTDGRRRLYSMRSNLSFFCTLRYTIDEDQVREDHRNDRDTERSRCKWYRSGPGGRDKGLTLQE